jgi:hypothetical protein
LIVARALVFFLALAVLAKTMFAGPGGHLEQLLRLRGFGPAIASLLAHVPFAMAVALLGWHARVWNRLPRNPAWYVLLLFLAASQVAITWYRFWMVVPFVKPLLLAAVTLVMLRLTPRTGTLYEATTLPGVTAFLGLTLLLGASFRGGDDFFRLVSTSSAYDAVRAYLPFVPPELVISAAVVAVFIMASRLRERSLQPTSAVKWLRAGVLLFIVAETLRQVAFEAHRSATAAAIAGLPFASEFVISLGHFAQALLFVGAFQLFASLLPRRGADELA